jgi:hypothetical protein
MEKFQEARAEAKKRLLLADHMLSLTYPLVKDTRLLIAITENLFLALMNSLAALLYYERAFKRIPPFHDNFDSKFNMFTEEVSKSHNLSRKYAKLLMEVRALLLAHRESPIEFSRNENFVMCTENYKNMKTISVDSLKDYLMLTKQFMKEVEAITEKDEKIFAGSKRRT